MTALRMGNATNHNKINAVEQPAAGLPVRRAHGEARVGREEELVLAVNGAVGAVDEVDVHAAPVLGEAAVEVEGPQHRLLEGRLPRD